MQAVRQVADRIGNEHRSTNFNAEQEYSLLKSLLNKESLSDELLIKARQALKQHDEISDIRVRRDAERDRFFNKSYVTFADGTDSVVTGIISIVYNAGDSYFEPIEPLRRCKSSEVGERFPELAGYLAMLKVYTEENAGRNNASLVGDCLPRATHHFEDLDMITAMWDSPDHFKGVWMFTPCSTT